MQSKPPRPTGVTLLAILSILIGISALLGGLAILALSALTSVYFSSTIGLVGEVLGGVVLFFGLIWLLVGVGFLGGKGWAWVLGMIFSVLSLLGSIGSIIVDPPAAVVGLLIWGLMLYYLTRPRVKAFFGKGGLPVPPIYGPSLQYRQPPILGNSQGFSQQPSTTNIPSYSLPPASPPTLTFNPLPAGTSTPASQIGSNTNPSIVQAIVSCPNCGSRLAIGQHNCPACGASI